MSSCAAAVMRAPASGECSTARAVAAAYCWVRRSSAWPYISAVSAPSYVRAGAGRPAGGPRVALEPLEFVDQRRQALHGAPLHDVARDLAAPRAVRAPRVAQGDTQRPRLGEERPSNLGLEGQKRLRTPPREAGHGRGRIGHSCPAQSSEPGVHGAVQPSGEPARAVLREQGQRAAHVAGIDAQLHGHLGHRRRDAVGQVAQRRRARGAVVLLDVERAQRVAQQVVHPVPAGGDLHEVALLGEHREQLRALRRQVRSADVARDLGEPPRRDAASRGR